MQQNSRDATLHTVAGALYNTMRRPNPLCWGTYLLDPYEALRTNLNLNRNRKSQWLPPTLVAAVNAHSRSSHTCTMRRSLCAAADHVVFSRPGLLSLMPIDPASRKLETELASGDIATYGPLWLCAWAAVLRDMSESFPLARVIGVTLGSDGFVWLEKGIKGENGKVEVHHVTAPSVEVVDTTCAGDVFHGVYTLGLGRGDSVRQAATVACAAAALKCRAYGRHGCPSAEELQDFLKTWAPEVTQCGNCSTGTTLHDCRYCGGV
jgi:hypothetical protein